MIETAANSKKEWEWCNCIWLGDEPHPEISGAGSVACGCGENDCEINCYRQTPIHWRGKHWKVICAFKRALAEK